MTREAEDALSVLLGLKAVGILHVKPLVLAVYDSDFEKHTAEFAHLACGTSDLRVFVQLGYEHETVELAGRLASAIGAFRSRFASVRVLVLANTALEAERFSSFGVDACVCHQNALLDERRYALLPLRKRHDAVYLARLTPCKRHALIPPELGDRLLLLASANRSDEQAHADSVRARYASARQVRAFRGLDASRYLCRARCGLALSDREGAMFASAEYFLCGLPVVNTPSVGGREVLFPEGFYCNVEPEVGAVRDGIARWVANPPDPRAVRAAWLRLAEPHRRVFRERLSAFAESRFVGRIPHKLGVRIPRGGEAYMLAARAYLLGQKTLAVLTGGRRP